jgi:hypothetical protein
MYKTETKNCRNSFPVHGARGLLLMIERAAERKVHFRFILDLMQILTGVDPLPSGDRIEGVLTLAAISLGEMEGRPFTVTKLANYLKMPRGTVQRRLADLVEKGYIMRKPSGSYVPNPERINSPAADMITDKVSGLIRRAAADLDSAPSGPQAPPVSRHPR